MRILVLSNLYPPDVIGGYELACGQMVEALRRRGHGVRVLTSTPRSVGIGTSDEVLRVLRLEELWDPDLIRRIHPVTHRLAWLRAGMVQTHNLELLHAELEAFRPDVVYLWNLLGLGAAGIALTVQLLGFRWVWQLEDAVHVQMAEGLGPGGPDFIRLFSRRLRGTWISCSQALLEELEDAGAQLGGRVETLANWVAGELPKPRTAWYDGTRPLRAAWTGRLVEEKGAHLVIDAMSIRRNAGAPPIELEVFGDGPEREPLAARVTAAGLDAAVTFHGRKPHLEMLAALGEADVLLFPTEMREPFGLAPLEAAAAGCVPIVTAGCGITEWLVDGVHLVTAERTAAAFAASLAAVQGGTTDLAGIGRRGQAVASEMQVDAVAARVESILAAAEPGGQPMPWDDISRLARMAERLILAGC